MQLQSSFLYISLLYFITLNVCYGFGFLAPVSGVLGAVFFSAYCQFKECCDHHSILADFDGLEKDLKEHVYGQHIVQEIVVNALRSHWNGQHRPQKALTLSFHGGPGSGKNYVTKFIIDNMLKYGSKSGYVHHFIGRKHFPSEVKLHQYQEELYHWIRGNVTSCSKQIFVFEEVYEMPPRILNMINAMIDYRDDVDGVDYRETVFIFLSNTGTQLINEHFLDLWKSKGLKREDLELRDFEFLIAKAYDGRGVFQFSDTINSHLIDSFVPFLPMELRHVKMCIVDEFRRRGIVEPSEEQIRETLDFIEWGPFIEKLFATAGCKRISQKVGTVMTKYEL